MFATIVVRLLKRLKVNKRLDLAEVLIDGGLLKTSCAGESLVRTPPAETAAEAS